MNFDDWQLDKLRAALRAHRAYTPGRSGPGLTWLELAGDIEAYTNAAMSPEVLRQFVEGVSKKDYPVRFRVPSPENLDAILAYLTDPHIDALAADELDQERLPWQVPLRLIEYLRQQFDNEALPLPASLEGTYRAALIGNETITLTQLTLRPDADNGFIRVAETSDVYTHADNTDVAGWTDRERRTRHRARTAAQGWAVLTPEDNLLFFLKEGAYGRNHYWTLAAEADLWSDAPVPRLTLLRHDYPAEPEDGQADSNVGGQGVLPGIARHILRSLFSFERTG